MPPKAAKTSEPEVVYSVEEIEELDAQEKNLTPSPAERQEIERTSRAEIAVSTEFGITLFGSWALYHDQDTTKQGLVVAEPQAGVYLLEFYDLVNDSPTHQKLIELKELVGVGDEGGTWTFYDDRESIRTAIKRLMT